MKREEYERLCKEAWEHNRRYYIDHQPTITDYEFDQLLKRIEEIESAHPDWILSDSPTQRVGEALSEGFATVAHRIPMLSLSNTYSKEELADFLARTERMLGRPVSSYTAELKMDGTALSITYESGKLVRAVTRGNGREGDEITANARTICNLPLRIEAKEEIEVRGEVYMPHATFRRLNEQREEAGLEPWANPRNAAAGSLKLLDPAQSAQRGLMVALYAMAAPVDQAVGMKRMRALGLPVVDHFRECPTIDEIWPFIEEVEQLRPTLGYDIDGVVVKVNSAREQQLLGSTEKSPRWAAAYKFAPEQATTSIREITVQVGRTGVLTPVAELKPAQLAGSTIARATLHNQEEIERKDIRVGDTVVIEKGGDVIPKVVSVDLGRRKAGTAPWQMPTTCPSCGTRVVHVEGEVAVRCPNREGCPSQGLRRLAHFVSKSGMDIEQMGPKVAEQLSKEGLIERFSDIYRLEKEDLIDLEGFQERSVDNLLASIERSREVPLARFLMAIGIPHVGAGTADLLARRAGTLEAAMLLSREQLLEIDGVGETVADSLLDFFASPAHKAEIEELLALGVRPQAQAVSFQADHPISGKSFVLTGTLENYTRQGAADLIRERGGRISSSVSRKTDFVVVGSEPGSKRDKAVKLGVEILNEDQFEQLIRP